MKNKHYFHPVFQGFNKPEGGVCPYANSSVFEEFEENCWMGKLREYFEKGEERAVVLDLQNHFGNDLMGAVDYFQNFHEDNLYKSINFEGQGFGNWYVVFMGDYNFFLNGYVVSPECHPRHFNKSIAVFLNKNTFSRTGLYLTNQIICFEFEKWIACRLGRDVFEKFELVRDQDWFSDKWELSIVKNETGYEDVDLFSLIREYNKYKGAVWNYVDFQRQLIRQSQYLSL